MINRTCRKTILFGHTRADAKMAGKRASRNQESDRVLVKDKKPPKAFVVTKRISPEWERKYNLHQASVFGGRGHVYANVYRRPWAAFGVSRHN